MRQNIGGVGSSQHFKIIHEVDNITSGRGALLAELGPTKWKKNIGEVRKIWGLVSSALRKLTKLRNYRKREDWGIRVTLEFTKPKNYRGRRTRSNSTKMHEICIKLKKSSTSDFMTYYMGEVRGFGMSGCPGFEKIDTFYKITWGRDDSWGESGIPNLTKLTKLQEGGSRDSGL